MDGQVLNPAAGSVADGVQIKVGRADPDQVAAIFGDRGAAMSAIASRSASVARFRSHHWGVYPGGSKSQL